MAPSRTTTPRRLAAVLIAAALAAPIASHARAADAGFTEAQRQEIVAIVRQALKTDPTILRDAVATLRADEARREQAGQDNALAANRATLENGAGDAVVGNRVGNVTLTEFYDPRCPYCRRMVPVIDQAIARDHGLRVVFKLIPILGPQSMLESRAIAAAGRQGGYVAMQEALMAESAPATDTSIAATARSLNLDPTRLARDMADPSLSAHLADNVTLAKSLGIDGTPAFVIGGNVISGALSQDELAKAIGEARK
jgi:protein-disulfide isomerase